MRDYKFGMTENVYKSIMESKRNQLVERSKLLQSEIDLGLVVGVSYTKELELINSTIDSL